MFELLILRNLYSKAFIRLILFVLSLIYSFYMDRILKRLFVLAAFMFLICYSFQLIRIQTPLFVP
jgi:hypothetical protein